MEDVRSQKKSMRSSCQNSQLGADHLSSVSRASAARTKAIADTLSQAASRHSRHSSLRPVPCFYDGASQAPSSMMSDLKSEVDEWDAIQKHQLV
jgi:hypothetical protein